MGAQLQEADLRGASLNRTSLDGADLSAADLRGADLSQVFAPGVVIAGAKINEQTKLPEGMTRELAVAAGFKWVDGDAFADVPAPKALPTKDERAHLKPKKEAPMPQQCGFDEFGNPRRCLPDDRDGGMPRGPRRP